MFESLGQYKILDRIGAGGMGDVYRARDTRLGRTVAIKVLKADVAGDPDRRLLFERDARAVAALSHPNIVALYEIGEDRSQLFLAFEYAPGETLTRVIAGRPMNPRMVIDLAVQIADALADAHAAGIVHHDLKPDNIIVTPKGSAKVLDVGFAKWTAGGRAREQAATSIETPPGAAVRTAAYMSPEQARGEPADQRTDIFSFGIILFEMLTGAQPFKGSTASAIGAQIVQSRAPAPSSINASVPAEFDRIVAKMLTKSPSNRHASAATLAAELRAVGAILDVRSDVADERNASLQTIESRRSYVGAVATVLIAALLAGTAWAERGAIRHVWRRTIGPRPAPIIAVLPLELADPNDQQRFFAEGLTDDLITRLGQTPGLKVIGRSATRANRGRSPSDVAHELGAAVVLAGTVRHSGDAVKVSLELVDPEDGTDLWTGQFTRDTKEIFLVQTLIAEEVASALHVNLHSLPSGVRAAARRVDPQAYGFYLRGRQAAAERRLPQAIAFFERAIAADAGLVEAFAGLAEALHLEGVSDGQSEDPARVARIRATAQRAYEQDPDLPQANLALGLAADTLPQALGYLRHAIDVDPSFAEGYRSIGDLLEDADPALALTFFQKSLDLDPRLDASLSDIAIVSLLLNRPDDARKAVADRGRGSNLPVQVSIELDQRRYTEALAIAERVPQRQDRRALWLQYVLALRSAGRSSDALRESGALTRRFPVFCDGRAVLAGLTAEQGSRAAGRQMAAPILEAAAPANATAAALGCAAVAAAALKDPATAALLLERIAGSEAMLRGWVVAAIGQTPQITLRGRVYPWTNVINDPALDRAKQMFADAYARQRGTARAALAGVFPNVP